MFKCRRVQLSDVMYSMSSHYRFFNSLGYGSNLTMDGEVECDASIMDGTTEYFGSVGAVTGLVLLPKLFESTSNAIPRSQEPHPPCKRNSRQLIQATSSRSRSADVRYRLPLIVTISHLLF